MASSSRKRKRQPTKWKRYQKKRQRYSASFTPEKPKCKHLKGAYQCHLLRNKDIKVFHKAFYSTPEKIAQDNFILKHCKCSPPKRSRTRDGTRTPKDISVKYYIKGYKKKRFFRVCCATFLMVLDVKKGRVRNICNHYLTKGTTMTENRGGDRRSQKNENKLQEVVQFIQRIPTQDGHYCREQNPNRTYVSSELNIRKLWKMYSESASEEHQVNECYFRNIFNTKFNIGFGSPRTDVCSTCLQFEERKKAAPDQQTKDRIDLEYQLHVNEADLFYEFLRERKDGLKTLSFDCEKNLPLPKVPDQSAYYSRQLYLHNFCVVVGTSNDSLKPENMFCYTWLEHEHAKGSSEIASALYNQLCNLDCSHLHTVRLACDGCVGQNKNRTILGMVSCWLGNDAPDNIKQVEIIYPVTGHSFLPPDRVFGVIEKKIRKMETVVKPSKYYTAMSNTTIRRVEHDWKVLDWKSDVEDLIKPANLLHFKISKCKRLIVAKNRNKITVRGEYDYLTDNGDDKSVFKRGRNFRDFDPERKPVGNQVKIEKLRDVRDLLKKHFGENWESNQDLKLFQELFQKFNL